MKKLILTTAAALGLFAGTSQAQLTGFEALTLSGETTVGSTWTIGGNGYGGPYVGTTSTVLTFGAGNYIGASAFANTTQTVGSAWTASFTLDTTAGQTNGAVGFVLQNDTDGAAAIPGINPGNYVGTQANITPGYGIYFKTRKEDGGGADGNFVAFGSGTLLPGREVTPTIDVNTTPVPMSFDFTSPLSVSLSYDGTNLTTSLVQGLNTWSDTRAVNLSTVLGASTSYVGFAASGESNYQVAVSDFAFAPVPEPTAFALLVGSLTGLMVARRRRKA
jgi:hypothetical protein